MKAAYEKYRAPVLTLTTLKSLALCTVVILSILLGNFVILFASLNAERGHNKTVEQGNDVLLELERLISSAKDAETGMRGFVVTGKERFLDPYLEGGAAFIAHLRRAQELTNGNPEQQAKLFELGETYDGLSSWQAEVVAAVRQGGMEVARNLVSGGQGKSGMDNIRRLVRDISDIETRLLSRRVAGAESAASRLNFSIIIAAAISLILVLLSHYYIRQSLVQQAAETQRMNSDYWLQTGLAELGQALRGNTTMEGVAQGALDFLSRYIGARVGAMYVLRSGVLERAAVFACEDEKDRTPKRLSISDSVIGEAIRQMRVVELTDLPESYIKISSALGDAPPNRLIVFPLVLDDEAVGAVELGFFNEPPPGSAELFRQINGIIGAAVCGALARTVEKELLRETQRQAVELVDKQERLKASNEEFEMQTSALRTSQETLQIQQEALRQTNEELEQQAKAVELQRKALTRQNTELTEAKEALEVKAKELEQVSRYKTEFMANMSHELRTPLNSLLLLATLLVENQDQTLSEKQLDFARTIFKSGNDLLVLINDILDLSKVEAGKLDLYPEQVEIADFVASMRREFQVSADSKDLQLNFELDDSVPKVLVTDRQRVEQILKNLLANAIKFTSVGGVTLTILRTYGPTPIQFAVRDSGIGIAKDMQDLIFEAFRQGDGSPNRAYGGTGLGLTISRELAALLGGSINVKSTPGEGSTFTLSLPDVMPELSVSEEKGLLHSIAVGKTASTKNADSEVTAEIFAILDLAPGDRLVLVVEDDVTFGNILVKLAIEAGFRAVLATTAEAALKFVRRHPVCAILLDIKLPDMSGLSVLEHLKNGSSSRHVPIHVVSGADYKQNAMSLGAIGYLAKPAQHHELQGVFKRLEEVLAKKVKRILIVEDDNLQRQVVKDLLGGGDIEVDEATTGAEAKSHLKSRSYDCVILDLRLPDITGFELLTELECILPGAKPPVVIHTAQALTRDEQETLELYADSIVLKGAKSPERLLDEVSLFLHRVETRLPENSQGILKRLYSEAKGLDGRRVLLVDDDMRNVFAIANALEGCGVKAVVARHGREALTKLDGDDGIELVLMDIMMPEMDGYEAMKKIRDDERFKKLPIIALTAKAMSGDLEKCLAAGANDYLPKPVILERLLSLLKVWLPPRV